MTSDPINVTLVAEPLWHRVPGGTGVAARELISGLAERTDVALDLVVGRRARIDDTTARAPGLGRINGMVPRGAPLPRVLLYEAWSRTGRPDIASADTDLIHSPMLPAPTSSDRPVVVTLHDVAWQQRPDDFPSRARRLYERMFDRVCSDASMVICSSAMTRRDAVSAGLPPERAIVNRLGVRPLDPSRIDARARFGLDGPFILFVGTAEPRKNLARLATAFGLSGLWRDGMSLVVAGPSGWGDALSPLEQLSNGASGKVKVLGEVTDDELGGLYAACHVFAYPSLAEGFGMPVLEALSCGAVVVTSSGTATEEVAGDAAVLVDPFSSDSISAGLIDATTDTSLRRRVREAGAERVELHSWRNHVDASVKIYQQVLGRD